MRTKRKTLRARPVMHEEIAQPKSIWKPGTGADTLCFVYLSDAGTVFQCDFQRWICAWKIARKMRLFNDK